MGLQMLLDVSVLSSGSSDCLPGTTHGGGESHEEGDATTCMKRVLMARSRGGGMSKVCEI